MPAEGSAVPTSADVFERYRDRIHRYVLRLTRDPEPRTQETFLRAHRWLGSLEDPAALAVWLYRIATHVCYDRFRRSSGRPPTQSLDAAAQEPSELPDAEWAESDAPGLDRVVEQAEMSACVREYLERLPDDYRMVILLRDVHGLTGREIAQMLGSSLDAVKIRMHRARRRLKAALEAECDFSRDERDVLVCERRPPNR